MNAILVPFQSSVYDLDAENTPAYKLTTREYASGAVEMIMKSVDWVKELAASRNHGIRGPARERTEEEKEAAKEDNLHRAERRAKQSVHQRILQIGADHLLTLTYRENVTDSEKLAADFTRFIRLLREKYPNWQYVAVKEYQERGSLHMHIACVGKQDIQHLRRCWYLALGAAADAQGDASPGQVDVQYRKKRFSGQSPVFSALQLSSYLTKYISKTFQHERELGTKRYHCSRGIGKPAVMRQYLGAIGYVHREDTFPTAARETLGIADLMGVKDYQIWCSSDLSVMVLRGNY